MADERELATETYRAGEGRPCLVLLTGTSVTSKPLPEGGSLTFGRSSECDLVFDHASVSRCHAEFFGPPELRVQDLESHNGTRVRGVAIAAGTPLALRPGDVVECGAALLVVRIADADASENPLVPALAATTLVVSDDARWFERTPGGRIEFGRHGALRRLLLGLAERRIAEPGRGASAHELFELGWPGERASVESAQTRVYTSIQRLRALGLEGVLVTHDDGYLLDPGVEVRISRS